MSIGSSVGRPSVRSTKLVCTIGPASANRLPELIEAGLDVARINFSHGTPDEWAASVAAVRKAAQSANRPVAVLADLPGPKVRLGNFAADAVQLVEGARFVLRAQTGPGDQTGVDTSYPRLARDLQPGDRVLLADGAAELRVVAVVQDDVETEVVRGGVVRSHQGVNVPSERLSIDALTDRDRQGARVATELGVDYVAQSFVRRADDVRALRRLLGDSAPPIVAKIETAAALGAIDEIVAVSDALMVARGDLGVELPFEEVPLLQKMLLRKALAAGLPSIVATQMLESMINAPRPTRAEASDVANAVLDGADAVMLSAETAVGAYPIEAAAAAVRIVEAVERGGIAAPSTSGPGDTSARAGGTPSSGRGSGPGGTWAAGGEASGSAAARGASGSAASREASGSRDAHASAGARESAAPAESAEWRETAAARASLSGSTEGSAPDQGASATGTTPMGAVGLDAAEPIIWAAASLARREAGIRAIATFTRSGLAAELLSALRPGVPVVALSPDPHCLRRLALRHGVVPRPSGDAHGTDEIIALLDRELGTLAFLRPGDPVLVVASSPSGVPGANLLELHRLS
ncbi:MAG: pyruvate kinase [Candidatus Limnocylindrales bacterium]